LIPAIQFEVKLHVLRPAKKGRDRLDAQARRRVGSP
jgi:hypothetical protein